MENFIFLFGGKENILLIESKPLTALCNIYLYELKKK